jgi:hypothetical protein
LKNICHFQGGEGQSALLLMIFSGFSSHKFLRVRTYRSIVKIGASSEELPRGGWTSPLCVAVGREHFPLSRLPPSAPPHHQAPIGKPPFHRNKWLSTTIMVLRVGHLPISIGQPTDASACRSRQYAREAGISQRARFAMAISQNDMW